MNAEKLNPVTTTEIPFQLNRTPGVLTVVCEVNQSATKSGFDLFAASGFDVDLCLGYPTMRAYVSAYEGTGYYTASAWIQIVTRREFLDAESTEPLAVITNVDVHETLEELGVPFFALGFPAEIFDAPCNNLGNLGKLDWLAETFFVTLPTRINNFTITPLAGFSWGYCEYDLQGKRQIENKPLMIIGNSNWEQHLSLLCTHFPRWRYDNDDSTKS